MIPIDVYAESTLEVDYTLQLVSDFRDLSRQAYVVRQAGMPQRIAFFDELSARLMSDGGRWADDARVHEAEAMHLITFSLSSELDPMVLLRRLRAPLGRLNTLSRHDAALRRYFALLRRTSSMSASKLDDYTYAYRAIIAAHAAIADAPPDAELTRDEARQQVWLQECGQLTRLVETTMIESDWSLMRRALVDGEPPTHERSIPARHLMRWVAARAVTAGRMAGQLIDEISKARDLDSAPNPEYRLLAAAGWPFTARIMYARAILVQATIEYSLGRDGSWWQAPVAQLYEDCVFGETTLLKPRLMDLNRLALHWSFLAGGSHPMAGRPYYASFDPKNGAPAYLRGSINGRLDRMACSRALAAEHNNANILDNLGFADFYRVFEDRAGLSDDSYTTWLARHRDLRRAELEQQLARRAEAEVADEQIAVRTSQRDTLSALPTVARLAANAAHYATAG